MAEPRAVLSAVCLVALWAGIPISQGPALAQTAEEARSGPITLPFPEDLTELGWLAERKAAQQKALGARKVLHDFQLSDRRQQSGITFRHRVVDDAARNYKAVHYDHGNSVSVADVIPAKLLPRG